VRRLGGVVEVPLFGACDLRVGGQVAGCMKSPAVFGAVGYVVTLIVELGVETEAETETEADRRINHLSMVTFNFCVFKHH
jgi:hypothetical protein